MSTIADMLKQLEDAKKKAAEVNLRIQEQKQTTESAIKIQDTYDLSPIQNMEKLVLFLVPASTDVIGGVMSIFSLCDFSRELCNGLNCLISTYPGLFTYSKSEYFESNEKVYRWKQIVQNAHKLKELIIHIPECFSYKFYKSLDTEDLTFFKKIETLQINILNQNIEYMPPLEYLDDLKLLTNNITQTVAHNRYASQSTADKWKMPVHLFSSCFKHTKPTKIYPFNEKEKIITLSPDKNENRDKIIAKLQEGLTEYELITIQDLPFHDYCDLVSRAYFSITFGEGFDGYFIHPLAFGSIAFSVYNDEFFPDKSWKEFSNVFESYDEMYEKIVEKIIYYETHEKEYIELSSQNDKKRRSLYVPNDFQENIRRFYRRDYHFKPSN